MDSKNLELLLIGLNELNITVNEEMIHQLDSFLRLYQEWNKVRKNLSSITEEREIIIRHIFDSLAAFPILKSLKQWNYSNRFVDLGSGGGLPGVPLKIIDPNIHLDFAEVNKKKICFLEEVILNLPLLKSGIVDSSARKVKDNYQLLLTRAFGSLKKITQEACIYIRNKGVIIAYKGRNEKLTEEIAELSPGLRDSAMIMKIETPFLKEQRHLVILNLGV